MTRIAASTDKGVRRPTNQDAHCLKVAKTPYGELSMVAVCDGVGGLASGELASSTMVRHLMQWFARELPRSVESALREGAATFDPAILADSLTSLIRKTNDGIWRHGENEESMLGTTITAVVCCAGRYVVAHVGDTRAYLVGESKTIQVSVDQTVAERELAAGRISASQLERHPGKSVLLQAVGTQPTIWPSIYSGTYAPHDLFVVCCDGAWHHQGESGIRSMFQPLRFSGEAQLGQACDEVVSDDIAHGETDNLTIAVLGPDGGIPTSSGEPAAPLCLCDAAEELAKRGDPNATAELDLRRRGESLR